jgi:hypothetical protein
MPGDYRQTGVPADIALFPAIDAVDAAIRECAEEGKVSEADYGEFRDLVLRALESGEQLEHSDCPDNERLRKALEKLRVLFEKLVTSVADTRKKNGLLPQHPQLLDQDGSSKEPEPEPEQEPAPEPEDARCSCWRFAATPLLLGQRGRDELTPQQQADEWGYYHLASALLWRAQRFDAALVKFQQTLRITSDHVGASLLIATATQAVLRKHDKADTEPSQVCHRLIIPSPITQLAATGSGHCW